MLILPWPFFIVLFLKLFVQFQIVNPHNKDIADIPGLAPPANRRLLWIPDWTRFIFKYKKYINLWFRIQVSIFHFTFVQNFKVISIVKESDIAFSDLCMRNVSLNYHDRLYLFSLWGPHNIDIEIKCLVSFSPYFFGKIGSDCIALFLCIFLIFIQNNRIRMLDKTR